MVCKRRAYDILAEMIDTGKNMQHGDLDVFEELQTMLNP